jgi:hypothetical protein
MKQPTRTFTLAFAALLPAAVCLAQTPRINTLFPIGGKAGTTVEVEVRGSAIAGADRVIVNGRGVTGTVNPGGEKPDEKFKPLFEGKCGSCHELRSPSNRSMTPAQWAATVDRMVKQRGAPLSEPEAANVSSYLQALARAGKVTAKISVAPDVLPGLYEVRLANGSGVSTAGFFEVGSLPEVVGVNNVKTAPLDVTLPCVANGTMVGNAERHHYRFKAKAGQRLVFNLKGYRYNPLAQLFFNPNLRLYDSTGKEIAENHGYYDIDPVLDWTCAADGDYTLEVRDLLGKGNPGSVYRMAMGPVSYDSVVYPPAVPKESKTPLQVVSRHSSEPMSWNLEAPAQCGITLVGTPAGPHPVYVSPYLVARDDAAATTASLPQGFTGRFGKEGEADLFTVKGDGAYEIEIYGAKLGSSAVPVAQVLDGKGAQVGRVDGERRGVVRLKKDETYTLRVTDAAGGPTLADRVYYVEVRPAGPMVQAVIRPDTVTVRAGATTAVEIRVLARERSEGDLEVAALDLPPGVTAAPIRITPDRQEGYLLLTASPNAAPGDVPIRVQVKAAGGGLETVAMAVPQEEYRINNNPRYRDRTQCVLSVRPAAPVSGKAVVEGSLKVHPRKGVPLKVTLQRNGDFKGPVVLTVRGLPRGWVVSPETVAADKNELTLTVRPDGQNRAPFLQRDAKFGKIVAIVEATVSEYSYVIAALPVEPETTRDEDDP